MCYVKFFNTLACKVPSFEMFTTQVAKHIHHLLVFLLSCSGNNPTWNAIELEQFPPFTFLRREIPFILFV